ncbi:MAG: hypothetical protein ABNH26_03500 [Celeribacter sp.]|jgi:hypothetical protein
MPASHAIPTAPHPPGTAPLRGTVAWVLGLLHLALAAVHLGLGSALWPLIALTVISLNGCAALLRDRIWPGDAVLFYAGLYGGTLALIIKAGLGQSLQSNLGHADAAATLLLMGHLGLWAAVRIAGFLAARMPAPPMTLRLSDPILLRRAFLPLLALGIGFSLAHVLLRPRLINGVVDQGSGFGGFGTFSVLLVMALAAGVLLAAGHRVPRARLWLLAALALMLGMTLIANTKKELGEALIVLAMGAVALRLRPSPARMLGVLTVGAVLLLYVGPVVHIMRADFLDLGLGGRIAAAWTILTEAGFDPRMLRAEDARIAASFSYAYREGGSYIYPVSANLDRFALILPMDQVLRGVAQSHVIGPAPFLREVAEGVLPSMLIAKSAATGADLIAWDYGIRIHGNAARPVLGLAASALAIGGPWAVLPLVFVVMLPIALLLDVGFGDLRRGLAGYTACCITWILAETTLDAAVVFALRHAVLAWLACWLVSRVFVVTPRSRP